MVPNINNRGQSFKGVTAYLMFDKDMANTSERVGFTHTENLHTNDVMEASRFMAWTDLNREHLKENTAGRKASAGNVYHYSISWQDNENPTPEHMKETALKSVERLGLSKHQMYMVEHTDEDHKHMHIVVNLVDPENGKIANVKSDMKRLDRWANEYEKENGIVCHDRAKKYEAWEQGQQAFEVSKTKNERKKIYETLVHESFVVSDNGKSFKSALSEYNLTLTQGKNRSFVVVDNQGDYYALPKLLPKGTNTKEVKARFSDLDAENLPRTDDIAAKNKVAFEQQQERKLDNDKSTKERADEYLQLARNPLQDLRGWMDETGTGIGYNSMPLGQDASSGNDKALRQVRGESGSGSEERANARLESEAQSNSNANHRATSERETRLNEYQKSIDDKTAASRLAWNIDELTQAKEDAAKDLENNSGWWARLTFKTRDYREALDATEKTLDDRLTRFKSDIEAFNKNRPEWARNAELEKHGFAVEKGKSLIKVEDLKAEKALYKTDINAEQMKSRTAKEQQKEKMRFDVPEVANDFKENSPLPQKLQRDMTQEELNNYAEDLRSRSISKESYETSIEEFQEVSNNKAQRDMTAEELDAERERLRARMIIEQEQAQNENDIELDRD